MKAYAGQKAATLAKLTSYELAMLRHTRKKHGQQGIRFTTGTFDDKNTTRVPTCRIIHLH